MKLRTKLIISALVLLGILAVIIFLSRKQTALLTVTSTDPQAIITVSSHADGKAVTGTHGVQGRFSQKVPVGEYIVAAQTKASSAKQTITLKPGAEAKINLTFSSALPIEMVAGINASNFVDDGQNLQFINRDTNTLTRITSQNQITSIANYSFSSVHWADPSFGAGLLSDGKLTIIKNLAPATLNVPFTFTGSSSLAVAPNHDIYVSDGSIVYLYSGGKFTKVYETKHPLTILAASNAALIALESGTAKSGQKADEGDLIRITRSGQSDHIQGESYDGTWSPDGEKVIVNGDEGTSLLDKNLKMIIKLPQSNVNSPVWLDNSTLAFSIGSDVWRFDTSSGLSQQIATLPNLTVTEVYPAKDGSYIYIAAQNYKDGKNQSIRRIPLKGQPVTTTATILGLILPNTVGQCHLSYINFTTPAVSVQGPKAQQAACTASAQKYLQTYHVPTAGLGLSFSAL